MVADYMFPTAIVAVEDSIAYAVKEILGIARATLEEHGSHLPTAILHTLEGLLPIVLPFKSEEQKKGLVEYVKIQAVQRHAYAVTTVTCAKIVDSRSGEEEEAIIAGTVIQGGSPYVMVQRFFRNEDRVVTRFEDPTEGDHAAMPGQMLIFPDWEEEIRH